MSGTALGKKGCNIRLHGYIHRAPCNGEEGQGAMKRAHAKGRKGWDVRHRPG